MQKITLSFSLALSLLEKGALPGISLFLLHFSSVIPFPFNIIHSRLPQFYCFASLVQSAGYQWRLDFKPVSKITKARSTGLQTDVLEIKASLKAVAEDQEEDKEF